MKKHVTNFAKLCLFLSLLTFYLSAAAQTPMYAPPLLIPGSAQTMPFNATAVLNVPPPLPYRHQTLYLPGEFGSALPANKYITTIYIRTSTVSSNVTYNGFEVALGQSTTTSLSATAWHNSTNVLTVTSFSPANTTAGGWIALTLNTPFLYDPAQSLVIDFKFTSATGTGFSVYSNNSVTGNRRSYNQNPAATAPSAANANRFDLGIDLKEFPVGTDNARVMSILEPEIFCAGSHDVKVKIGNRGSNILQGVNIQWTVDNVTQSTFYHTTPIDTLNSPNGTSDTILTLGNITFGTAPKSIKVWTEYPNYTPDVNTGDDTLVRIKKAGLSGNYTIGGTSPDYANFAAAINELHTYGVCGPVTFTVAPGTYSGQIQVNQVPGASAVNTITFDGGAASTTTLTHSTALVDSRHTFLLNGSKYIRIKNFTIRSTGTYGWPIHMLGTAAAPVNNIVVSKCILDLASSATTINFTGIVINGINNAPATGGRADSITIDSNVFNNGYYGVSCVGLTGNQSADNKFTNNTFNEPAYSGIWLTYQNGIDVSNNTIKGRATGLTYALYYSNSVSTAPRFALIQNNAITNIATYGIFLSGSNNSAGNEGRLINNMVGGVFAGATPSALVVNTASYWNIYHNTINNTGAGTNPASSALNVTTGTNLDVRNNIFAVSNPLSQGVVITATNASSFTALNNNVYYKPDTSTGILNIGSVVLFPFSFKGNAGLDLNSSFLDPGFVNDSVLTTSSGCLNGASLGVMTDLKNQARNAVPDIGCYEFQSVPNDLSVEGIAAPAFPMTPGLNDVVVKLRNLGNNAISSAQVSYTYNNTTVSGMWTGAMAVCDASTYTFNFSNQVNMATAIRPLKVFTGSPNAATDGNPLNDTLVIKVGAPLNGSYTIGGSNPDFITVNEAVQALNAVGVGGPVVFNIRTGFYNENVLIGSIQGASLTNGIRFTSQANHPDSVTVRYNASSTTDNYVFKLFNASFITIDAITISALNATNARGVVFTGASSFDTIQRCSINTALTSTTVNTILGVLGDNLTMGNIMLKNNVITGGNYNVNFAYVSESKLATGAAKVVNNITLEGNTLRNAGYIAVNMASHTNMKLINNTIIMSAPTYTTVYGVQVANADSAMVITGNKISATGLTATTLNGLRLTSCTASASKPGLIANNSIVTGSSGTTTYGFYAATMINQRYYNNSINTISTGTTNYAAYLAFTTTSANNELRNNIFSNRGTTGYALFVQDPAYVNSDYNLLYSTGAGGLVYKNLATASGYATLAAYRAAFPMQEVNSIQYRTPFISNINLSINTTDTACWAINGRAIHTVNALDINGNTRSTSVVNGAADIGAYEFTPASPALLATAIPAIPVAGEVQSFLIFGDTIAKITWAAFYPVPDLIGMRFYSGEYAPNTNQSHYRTNCYWDVQESGIGSYIYAIDLFYKETMKGSIVSESDMRMTKMHNNDPWTPYSGTQSSVDPVRNILSAPYLYNFSIFTGTDDLYPLQVTLSRFNAVALGQDVSVSWSTASEKNASHFIVEASVDGRTYVAVGKTPATGSSSLSRTYQFMHNDAQRTMNGSSVIYYRLNSVDKDGSHAYSDVVLVSFGHKDVSGVVVYPNPFTENLTLNIMQHSEGVVNIEVLDIGGRVVTTPFVKNLTMGTNVLMLKELNDLSKGVYFIKIITGNEPRFFKVIKN